MSTPSDGFSDDDRAMYNDETEGTGTLDDDTDPAAEPDVLSVDPDEYSDAPHMGSVPRVLGEEEYQPDTQGEDPIYAELGEDGQGDLAPEDR